MASRVCAKKPLKCGSRCKVDLSKIKIQLKNARCSYGSYFKPIP